MEYFIFSYLIAGFCVYLPLYSVSEDGSMLDVALPIFVTLWPLVIATCVYIIIKGEH